MRLINANSGWRIEMRFTNGRAHNTFSCLCLLLSLFQFYGCMVAKLYQGKPGLDTKEVKPGASLLDVEKVMGASKRDWTTDQGVRYRVYIYNGGVEGSTADAIAFGIMDVITLGIWEIEFAIIQLPDAPARKITEQMAVSYDQSDTVIGVFDHFGDFDILPDDGRVENWDRNLSKSK
jgi:hypothetical protein